MGTGCGGGFVIDGRLRSGQNRLAGEWGHVSVDLNGPSCWCGQKGCLETYFISMDPSGLNVTPLAVNSPRLL
jgi:predicted NBD/HSP70 family sugar kinase